MKFNDYINELKRRHVIKAGIAYLVDDDEEYTLDTEYDETIELNGARSKDFELVIDVPMIAEKGEDYSSVLDCIVTG